MRTIFYFLVFVCASAAQAKRNTPWAKITKPSSGPSEAIGGYSNGCIRGAVALPETGPGYTSIRRFRNRYYGHTRLVTYLKKLGTKLKKQEIDEILIGDLSQPQGGLMGYGHRSHQLGLDADIWFSRPKKDKRAKDNNFNSLVDRKREKIVSKRWTDKVIGLLRTAASDDNVSRIFVHWVIKNQLCRDVKNDRTWLRKIRAWWGHDRHFHVRLTCPKESKDCKNQGAIKSGDGCGAEKWFSAARVKARKTRAAERRKKRREKIARLMKTKKNAKRIKVPKKKKRKKTYHPRCQELLDESKSKTKK